MPKLCSHRLANTLCEEFLQLADLSPHFGVSVAVTPAGLHALQPQSRKWRGYTLSTYAPLRVWQCALGNGKDGKRVPFSAQQITLSQYKRAGDCVLFDLRGGDNKARKASRNSELAQVRESFESFKEASLNYFQADEAEAFRLLDVAPIRVSVKGHDDWLVYVSHRSIFELYADLMQHFADTIPAKRISVPQPADPNQQVLLEILESIDEWCWEVWIEWLALKRRRMEADDFDSLTRAIILLAKGCSIDPKPLLELDRWLAYHSVNNDSIPESALLEQVMMTVSQVEVECQTVAALSSSDATMGDSFDVAELPTRYQNQPVPARSRRPRIGRPQKKGSGQIERPQFPKAQHPRSKQDVAVHLQEAFRVLASECPNICSAIAWQIDEPRLPPIQRAWIDQWSVSTTADEVVWKGALGMGPLGPRLPFWAWWPQIDGQRVECVDYDSRGLPKGKVAQRRSEHSFWESVKRGDALIAEVAEILGLRWPTVVSLLAEPGVELRDRAGNRWTVRTMPSGVYSSYALALEKWLTGAIVEKSSTMKRRKSITLSPQKIGELTEEWLNEVLFHRIGFGGRGALLDIEFFELTETLEIVAERWGIDSTQIRSLYHLLQHVGDLGSRHTSLSFLDTEEFNGAELAVQRIATVARGLTAGVKIPSRNVATQRLSGNRNVPVYLGESKYRCGQEILILEYTENRVLAKLVKHGAAKKAELESVSENAISVLRGIKRKRAYRMLAPHIIFPGGKGKGGYRTTIIPASDDVFG